MGRLTTHVLDTANGTPAAGMGIELLLLKPGGEVVLASADTNSDGRCDRPLVEGAEFQRGLYELRFRAGDYFRRHGPNHGFYDVIPVRFRIENPEQQYHVPLLVSPYGYSTYRGS